MAIQAGQLKERADYQAYILEMLREENGYQVRPSTAYDPGYGMDVDQVKTYMDDEQREQMKMNIAVQKAIDLVYAAAK